MGEVNLEKQDYEASTLSEKTQFLRLFLVTTAALTLAFGAWDRLIDPVHCSTTLWWRILGGVLLTAIASSKRMPRTAAGHDLLVLGLAIAYSLFLIMIFSQLNKGLILGMPAISTALIVGSLLFVKARHALGLSTVLLACAGAAWMLGLDSIVVWSHLTLLAMSLGLGLLMALTLEDKDRKQFELRQELARLASTDSLTGALNRRAAQGLLDQESERSRRYERPLSALMLDIDHFKKVNDTWGHEWGDRVLRHIADLCRSQLRLSDSLIRWGGEEFLIILPETPLGEAGQLAERLRTAIELNPLTGPNDGHIQTTASIGYTMVESTRPWQASLARADEALYRAKAGGRNRCQSAGT